MEDSCNIKWYMLYQKILSPLLIKIGQPKNYSILDHIIEFRIKQIHNSFRHKTILFLSISIFVKLFPMWACINQRMIDIIHFKVSRDNKLFFKKNYTRTHSKNKKIIRYRPTSILISNKCINMWEMTYVQPHLETTHMGGESTIN